MCPGVLFSEINNVEPLQIDIVNQPNYFGEILSCVMSTSLQLNSVVTWITS